ncbi:uncharacterized protein LOC110033243 isoform X2 [Phalaenopsis equestris]|uniref:uncharacterized protein LOC110033243 isoform X1 n=1 Tax=Phalaenopsis equestris TaxID=78828 RepID=UPI0009E4CB9B|nr:uncharacterized protein LOC110033243 isoform X1 [Phalaenopsis equestris]XP_020592820.1 uncharacterized protein LOC110033243 isoform X2 [Phalaenopsis equestris]
MGGIERDGNDWAFRVNFAGEGAAGLQEKVKEKLKEFMGDYTDDTLVEYVIVLLRNGRGKDEAKRELNVFLGDDSDAFVTWLWDYLSLNWHLYAEPEEALTEEAANAKVTTNDYFGKSNPEMVQAGGASYIDSEHEDEHLVNVSRSRRNREWKGLVGETTRSFPLRSTVIEAFHSGEKPSQRLDIRHSSPSRPHGSKKRSREDERQPLKRNSASMPKLAPSRRLLEFAVRDVVKTVQQPSTKVEPVVRRLRSVVSSSVESTLNERPQWPRSTIRLPGSASVALKAAAEAAEDVAKSRNAGSVFDRLGHVKATVGSIDQSANMERSILQNIEDEEFEQNARSSQLNYNHKNGYNFDFTGNSSILNKVDAMAVDSASDKDDYDDFGMSSDHGLDASQYAYSANKRESSFMANYDVSGDTDTVVKKAKLIQQEAPPTAVAKPSSKIVNISVNVNAWNPPDYKVSRSGNEIENQMIDNGEQTTVKSNAWILKDGTSSILGNDKEMTRTDIQKESQKPHVSAPGVSYATSRPSEDVDSRTIFISNVHFAATKDTLSRHFNKFGEVLKVIIVTNPATCHPIGSAYVEFLRKESAELALSLNGTSFMSRILKVVRGSSVDSHAIGWPRIARPSPFTSRLGRMPFPRGILTGAFRARLPVKPGARSLQWKRESTALQTLEGPRSVQNMPVTHGNAPHAITKRNLTYIRPENT